jgi:hypothetical protein
LPRRQPVNRVFRRYGLQAQADAGGWAAAWRLGRLLADRGDLDEAVQTLRTLVVDAGDVFAARLLPGLLEEQGRGEEAERLRRFGLAPDGSIASKSRTTGAVSRPAVIRGNVLHHVHGQGEDTRHR